MTVDDHGEDLFWEETFYLHEEIKELEDSLEREKTRNKEFQFIAILVFVIFIDIFTFPSMQTFGGPLVIGILEAVALLLVAKKLGLKEFSSFLNRLIATVSPRS